MTAILKLQLELLCFKKGLGLRLVELRLAEAGEQKAA